MGLEKNMSDFLRAYKEISGKSNSELAEEMQISRSILRDYLNGDGNPRLSTVEHLADRLKVNPVLFLAGMFEKDSSDIVLLLFNSVREVISLPEPKRKQFVEYFLNMLSLFEDK